MSNTTEFNQLKTVIIAFFSILFYVCINQINNKCYEAE